MSDMIPFYNNDGNNKNSFLNKIDDFFDDLWKRDSRSSFNIDVKENDRGYCVEAELPGVKKEDVNLSYNNERLSITIQKNEHTEERKGKYIHQERRYGQMQRSLYIPDVDEKGINAKFENGLLIIDMPKSGDKPRSRKIDIQ